MTVIAPRPTRALGRVNVPTVTLAHGGGGKAMKDLIDDVFVAAFDNPALAALTRVYELRPFFEWRGLGSIDHSGVRIRPAYARFDAERRFALRHERIADPTSCQCGEVLKGVIKPWQCKIFGNACTPETPVGALMVSSEGACAAYYQYGGVRKQASLA